MNFFARHNAVCERYLLICVRVRPALSRGEWLAIFDTMNGTVLDTTTIANLAADIEDSAPEQIAQWGVSQQDLARRLRALAIPELVAIAETIERWWRAEGSHDERFAACGLIHFSERSRNED